MKLAGALFICVVLATSLMGGPLEDWIEASETPEELAAWIDDVRADSIDLNSASAEVLGALPLIDAQSAKNIVSERRKREGFSSLRELEEIEFLSRAQAEILAELTTIRSYSRAGGRNYLRGATAVSTNAGRGLDASEVGFRLRGDFSGDRGVTGFVLARRSGGDPDLLSEASVGVAMPIMHDRGRLIAGDYQVESGTGLVTASAYGMSNWLSSAEGARLPSARGVSSKPTSDGLSGFRGLAGEFRFPYVRLTGFVSHRQLDAALRDGEVESIAEGTTSSDPLGAARENQLRETLGGIDVRTERDRWEAGATAYGAKFSPGFRESEADDILPRLEGDELEVGAVYFRGEAGMLEAAAEIAGSHPGGYAHQSALTISDERSAWTAYHVFASEDFQSPHSKLWGGFGEAANNASATGIRSVMRWGGSRLAFSGSTERTPGRTATSPLRKSADDFEGRFYAYPVERIELMLLGGRRRTEVASADDASTILTTDRARLEAVVRGTDEYKLRLELRSASDSEGGDDKLGTVAYFQIKSVVQSISFTTRITVWNVEQSDASVSVYEPSVYGAHPLAALYDTGRRAMVAASGEVMGLRVGGKAAVNSVTAEDETEESMEFSLELFRSW